MSLLNLTTYFPSDVGNNWPSPPSDVTRGFDLVVPFISLYEPVEQTLALIIGSSRCITGIYEIFYDKKDLSFKPHIKIALSIASIVGTIFRHPTGMAITTCHDIYLNVDRGIEAFTNRNYDILIKQGGSLVNNIFSLITITLPSPQLKIASLAIKILIATFSAKNEYGKNRSPETIAHIFMGVIRLGQFRQHVQKFNQN